MISSQQKQEVMLEEQEQQQDEASFNPKALLDAFQASTTATRLCQQLHDEPPVEDIKLKEYLQAYTEITKFLGNMGSVFYFVIADVDEKILILKEFNESNPKNYDTILKMVDYEKNVINAFDANSPIAKTNGSRTVLRLHRALIFIYMFLDKLFTADSKAKSAHICTEVYEKTLAKYHGWLVRKAATIGMHALPKRESLVACMCRTPEDHTKFPTFVQCVERVYNITENIYQKYDILDLP